MQPAAELLKSLQLFVSLRVHIKASPEGRAGAQLRHAVYWRVSTLARHCLAAKARPRPLQAIYRLIVRLKVSAVHSAKSLDK